MHELGVDLMTLKRSWLRRGWTGAIWRWTALFLAGLLVGIVAGAYVIGRPTLPSEPTSVGDSFTVRDGTLSRSLQVPAVASWAVQGTVRSPAGGIITEVVSASGILHAGDIVLRINERPMVVIPGSVPAFREMTVGTRGRDVAALQAYLAELGYGVDDAVDAYTPVTAAAVRAWQEMLGLPATGTVSLGDVLIIDPLALQAPLRWTDAVDIGVPLAPGTAILERLSALPTLTVEFGGSPPAQLEAGLHGVATFPSGQRRDVTLAAFESSQGRQSAMLTATTGTLCAVDDCLRLAPPSADTPIEVEFILVPETSGPMLPVAAIQTDASGQSFVERPDGTRQPVRVLVASGGSAIVEGVSAGEEIMLP